MNSIKLVLRSNENFVTISSGMNKINNIKTQMICFASILAIQVTNALPGFSQMANRSVNYMANGNCFAGLSSMTRSTRNISASIQSHIEDTMQSNYPKSYEIVSVMNRFANWKTFSKPKKKQTKEVELAYRGNTMKNMLDSDISDSWQMVRFNGFTKNDLWHCSSAVFSLEVLNQHITSQKKDQKNVLGSKEVASTLSDISDDWQKVNSVLPIHLGPKPEDRFNYDTASTLSDISDDWQKVNFDDFSDWEIENSMLDDSNTMWE